MGKTEKLIAKLKGSGSTFPWKDLVLLLNQLGYEKKEMAGSRVRFFNKATGDMMLLHKPHPDNELTGGALRSVKTALEQEGWL